MSRALTFLLVITLFLNITGESFAASCSPYARIYKNSETNTEKYLRCSSFLNKTANFPINTNTFVSNQFINEPFCDDRYDLSKIEELNISDFSIYDKLKITLNSIVRISLFVLPIGLSLFLIKRTKQLVDKILITIFALIIYILYLFLLTGGGGLVHC